MNVTTAREAEGAGRLARPVVSYLAAAAAIATSTSYAVQPELAAISRDLGISLAWVGAASASAIVGYLVGLAMLVPLVDFVAAPHLLFVQLLSLAAGLLVAATARDVIGLALGLFVSGVCASTGAQMSTLASKHAAPDRRGTAVGLVTAGISAGILLGRIVGGAVADQVGWRLMLTGFATACAICAVVALFVLPRGLIEPSVSYLSTLRSGPRLLVTDRILRVAAAAGALWFFAFSLIWLSLSVALSLPPMNLSPTVIGLYSLAGLLGIVATPIAGRLTDRHGATRVIVVGLAISVASAVVMVSVLDAPVPMLIALGVFDAGLFAAQVANQSRVLAIDPQAPARYNSAYMVVYFVGGSLGTGIGGGIVTRFGWPVAAATAAGAILAAAAIVLVSSTRREADL